MTKNIDKLELAILSDVFATFASYSLNSLVLKIYLTIIPQARMGYESIAHEAIDSEAIDSEAIDSEAMRARGIIVLVKSN